MYCVHPIVGAECSTCMQSTRQDWHINLGTFILTLGLWQCDAKPDNTSKMYLHHGQIFAFSITLMRVHCRHWCKWLPAVQHRFAPSKFIELLSSQYDLGSWSCQCTLVVSTANYFFFFFWRTNFVRSASFFISIKILVRLLQQSFVLERMVTKTLCWNHQCTNELPLKW